MKLINTIKNIATTLVFLSALATISACSPEEKYAFSAIDITGANYATNFKLTDHNGQARQLQDFAGKVVVLFFGYTQCPDVCPTTMTEMAQVKKAMGKDGERLQVLFVSLDPQRDTPLALKNYMANFDPEFLALTAAPDQLAELAKNFKIIYRKVNGPTPTSYTIDHSAGSYIYDTKGRVRLFTRYGSGTAPLQADIKQLLKETS